MRSRYAAYALGLTDYIDATWDPLTRPARTADATEARLKWIDLRIHQHVEGFPQPGEAMVEFTAVYREGGRAVKCHERSRFRQQDHRWVYCEALPIATP
jgi:SEC-C motif domain protein